VILLKCNETTFEEYVSQLSKPGRENWAYVRKHNQDLTYGMIAYDEATLMHFMALWEKQPIRGVTRQWAFGIEHLRELYKNGDLWIFGAFKGEEMVSIHFVQMHENGYAEAHPPIWEKNDENKKRYLAKYMWFNLIKYLIDNARVAWLDFGGGRDDSWREMIKHRVEYPNPKYKWMYIPEDVKNNPDKQPDLMLIQEGGMRRLEEF
jgi:hypothetical protein